MQLHCHEFEKGLGISRPLRVIFSPRKQGEANVDINGKIAVVTGGASGIGAACVRAFAKIGAKVVAADLNERGAQALGDEVNGLGLGCDVGSEASVNELVERVTAKLGPIDIFYSNAGVSTGADPLSTPIETWNDQWQVNLMSHVYAVRAVLPSMLNRGSGYLLHTASMAGILTAHGNLTYAVTKHAVVGLAEWLSITYHDKGIRVSCLAPLGVRTPMLGDTGSPFARNAAGPIKEPEEVASQVCEAIENERFLVLTDEIAQTWMEMKTNDLERWLKGMRRLQSKIEAELVEGS